MSRVWLSNDRATLNRIWLQILWGGVKQIREVWIVQVSAHYASRVIYACWRQISFWIWLLGWQAGGWWIWGWSMWISEEIATSSRNSGIAYWLLILMCCRFLYDPASLSLLPVWRCFCDCIVWEGKRSLKQFSSFSCGYFTKCISKTLRSCAVLYSVS